MNKQREQTSSDVEFIKALRKGIILVACRVCGQCHARTSTHVYDYEGTVDDDLICHICFQPFVNPVDTKCGCTYCSNCLQNYLKRFKSCPIDNSKIEWKQCHKASSALRRILDKLLVVCPNVDYCEDVLPRHQLEFHLMTRCKGTLTYCTRASLGCNFQGPRSALQSHLQECLYNYKTDEYMKEPIIPGRFCQIEIHRGYYDLGLQIVGGSDTPLITTVVQHVKPNSVADRDGRILPGDHIVKLNDQDLTGMSHKEVMNLFAQSIPICNMTVYRETLYDTPASCYEYREELIRVTFEKQKNRSFGIKLGHKKKEKGIWILGILKGSLADLDGHIRVGDRLIEINNMSVKEATKSEALKIISDSSSHISFLLSREIQPNMAFGSLLNKIKNGRNLDPGGSLQPTIWQEFTLKVTKDVNEPLGIKLSGGINGFDGESTPLFVSSIESKTCIDRSKHIRKSDLILKIDDESLIGRDTKNAMAVVDETMRSNYVVINYVKSPEHCSEDSGCYGCFKPTWRYFISIPITYQIAKVVQLFRNIDDALGLTIAGGKDTSYDKIFIKSVIPNSTASRCKRLKSGDMILSVNGQSLQNVTHIDAVQHLKFASGLIRFIVISCPGSLI